LLAYKPQQRTPADLPAFSSFHPTLTDRSNERQRIFQLSPLSIQTAWFYAADVRDAPSSTEANVKRNAPTTSCQTCVNDHDRRSINSDCARYFWGFTVGISLLRTVFFEN
jgi:hypothetical protein